MKTLNVHIGTLLIAISTTLLCVNIHAQTTSNFSTGTTFTQYSLDPWGNTAAIEQGETLLLNSTKIVNQHVMGFGALNPERTPDNYDFSSIEKRIGNNTGLGNQAETVVLTACCAPDWMKGGTDETDWSRIEEAPFPQHFDDYAELVAEIVSRPEFSNIEYIQVWNEMKGLWYPPEDRWNYEAYIDLYNKVWDAVKAVDEDDSIKIGGPYVVVGVYGDRQTAQAKCNNRGMALVGDDSWGYFDCRDLEVIEEWLQHKNGADFIVVDGNIINKDDVYSPDVDQFKRTERFRAFMEWLRDLNDADAETLPVWWAEWYAVPENPNASQTEKNALMATALVRMIKSGASTALLWGPQGDSNGDMFPLGLFSDTRVSGGGQATPFHTTQRHLYDHFSEGTTLINATTDNVNIEVLASNDKTLLVNMSNSYQTLTFRGLEFSLEAYEVQLIDTPQIGGGDNCNLLNNGDFSDGTTDWLSWSCDVDASSGACRITNIQQVQNPWNSAVVQGDFTLENGKQYEVSFDAASIQNNRTIKVKVGLSEAPYTGYVYEEISLNTNNQRFTIPFTMSQPTTTKARLEFHVGTNTTGLVVDNIRVKTADADCPSECNIIKNGNFSDGTTDWLDWNCDVDANSGACQITNIQQVQNPWNAAVVQGDFTLENGKQYEVSFDANSIQNNRTIRVKVGLSEAPYTGYIYEEISLNPNNRRFTIPFTMSQPTTAKGRLEFHVGTSTTGLVVDNVQLISLSDDCTNNDCEQVQNGNFTGQFTDDWIIQNCQATTANNGININVPYVAQNPWNIAVKQRGLNYEQGKEYRISFKAKADAPRVMHVKAGKSSTPYTTYHFETVNLTTTLQTYTITFTMDIATDSNAFLEFFLGDNATDLFLGEVSVVETACAGLREGLFNETITDYNVFPNPTNHNLNVSLDLIDGYDTGIIRLFDLNGRIILEEEKALSSTNQFQLDIQAIPAGMYMLRVDVGGYFLTHKVVKY